MAFLKDILQDRLDEKWRETGDKPDDLIQWLIDEAPPIEKTVPLLVERVMALNVASIHTTTMVGLDVAAPAMLTNGQADLHRRLVPHRSRARQIRASLARGAPRALRGRRHHS